MRFLLLILFMLCLFTGCKNDPKTTESSELPDSETAMQSSTVTIHPISHSTLVLESEANVIYIDPVGGLNAFKDQKRPTFVLITDIHGDHFSLKTLEALKLNGVTVVVPKAVADKIPSTIASTSILNNGESLKANGLTIEAIPMYNLREEAQKFHTKGRGNGYVITMQGERIYISGDTEDIPEMRELKNIDKAFVCMNVPWTMPVEKAAEAVLEFQPKVVYPYHYRGAEGYSDVGEFEALVSDKDKSIKVELLKWY